MRFGAQVIVACAVMVLGIAPGRAAVSHTEPERSSRQHFQKGETHYSAGRFAEALTEYQAGYDAHPLPGFLVNIAQCYRRLGDLKRARASWEKFVWVAPDSPLAPEVRLLIAEVARLLNESEGAESGVKAGQEPGGVASEAVGAGAGAGNARGTVSLAAPVPASSAAKQPGSNLLTTAVPAPAPAAAGSTPGHAATHRRWWLWGTIGVAVLGGTVAAIALSSTPDATTIHEGTLGTLRR